jgi:hypothetical protein
VGEVNINGTAADISQSPPVPTYDVTTIPAVQPFFSGTTQSVRNLSLSGDTLRGEFEYIRPSYNNLPVYGTNTHPDTVSGTFLVKLVQVRSYNRQAGP